MVGIPLPKESDAEDVAWGLQTADALWKRGERIDALVWLRRAAQAAGDTNDDDRALELARLAAELAEKMAASVPPSADGVSGPSIPIDLDSSVPMGSFSLSSAREREPEPPSVRPAEQVHAGILNPWDEEASRPRIASPVPAAPSSGRMGFEPEVVTSLKARHVDKVRPVDAEPTQATLPRPPPLPLRARPLSAPQMPAAAAHVDAGARRPTLPSPSAYQHAVSRAPVPTARLVPEDHTFRLEDDVELSRSFRRATSSSDSPVTVQPQGDSLPPSSPTRELHGEQPREPTDAEVAPVVTAASRPALELGTVDAFADLPDDARDAFAAAATVHTLAESDEVSHFALAYVIEGAFDVSATMVDASAARVDAGAVLRARGTATEGIPMRLVCVSATGLVATWSDHDVDAAFRTCPWVEDDLRALADQMQTLVGITIGPLGERLDQALREQIVARLTMRPLAPGEVVVNAGESVPGLLLVGVGQLELVDGETVHGVVGSGEFLFPTEVLGAGAAPWTARAGAGGALVLFGDRMVAQELLVTCPPLLEVFAGM